MKILFPFFFVVVSSLLAAPEVSPSTSQLPIDYQMVATIVRRQRDGAVQALEDAQLQLEIAKNQIAELQAKIAQLEKSQGSNVDPKKVK
jgi:TolA-binding protein